jgi:uncharacterized cofD-like protein
MTPADAHASKDAVEAIAGADLIVLGPGSLYTSLLPNLLVAEIREAVRAARAPAVYVANVATQVGETESFTLADHLQAIVDHVGSDVIDVVLANDDRSARVPRDWPADPVAPELPDTWQRRVRFRTAAVVDPDNAHRHDPTRLAEALLALRAEETGPATSLPAGAARSA